MKIDQKLGGLNHKKKFKRRAEYPKLRDTQRSMKNNHNPFKGFEFSLNTPQAINPMTSKTK